MIRADEIHENVHKALRNVIYRVDIDEGGGYIIEKFDGKVWKVMAQCRNYREMMKKLKELRGIKK